MRTMTRKIAILVIVSMMPFNQLLAQASLPATDLRAVTNVIERDFASVDRIHTVGMTDDPDGRFDVIVIGSRPRYDGWRVEVLSVTHHKVETKWDSVVSAKGPQYSNSGSKSIAVRIRDYDYDLIIEACAQHLCYDGVSGFLLFSGKSERSVKAEVVTQGLYKPLTGEPKYDVTFSKNADDESRKVLERAICESQSISNKSGLPFSCPP